MTDFNHNNIFSKTKSEDSKAKPAKTSLVKTFTTDRILAKFEEPEKEDLLRISKPTDVSPLKSHTRIPMPEQEIFRQFIETYHSLDFVTKTPLLLTKAEMLRTIRGTPHNFYDAARVRKKTDKHLGQNGILAYLLRGSGWFDNFEDSEAEVLKTISLVKNAPLIAQAAAFDTRTRRDNWHDIQRRWKLLECHSRRYLTLNQALSLMEPIIAERISAWFLANPVYHSLAVRFHRRRLAEDPIHLRAPNARKPPVADITPKAKRPGPIPCAQKTREPDNPKPHPAKKSVSNRSGKIFCPIEFAIVESEARLAIANPAIKGGNPAKKPGVQEVVIQADAPSPAPNGWRADDLADRPIETWEDFDRLWEEAEKKHVRRMKISEMFEYLDLNNCDLGTRARKFYNSHQELMSMYQSRYEDACRADRELAMKKRADKS